MWHLIDTIGLSITFSFLRWTRRQWLERDKFAYKFYLYYSPSSCTICIFDNTRYCHVSCLCYKTKVVLSICFCLDLTIKHLYYIYSALWSHFKLWAKNGFQFSPISIEFESLVQRGKNEHGVRELYSDYT